MPDHARTLETGFIKKAPVFKFFLHFFAHGLVIARDLRDHFLFDVAADGAQAFLHIEPHIAAAKYSSSI